MARTLGSKNLTPAERIAKLKAQIAEEECKAALLETPWILETIRFLETAGNLVQTVYGEAEDSALRSELLKLGNSIGAAIPGLKESLEELLDVTYLEAVGYRIDGAREKLIGFEELG